MAGDDWLIVWEGSIDGLDGVVRALAWVLAKSWHGLLLLDYCFRFHIMQFKDLEL